MNNLSYEELWQTTRPSGLRGTMESGLKRACSFIWNAAIAYACEKVARKTDALPERIAEIKQESHT